MSLNGNKIQLIEIFMHLMQLEKKLSSDTANLKNVSTIEKGL